MMQHSHYDQGCPLQDVRMGQRCRRDSPVLASVLHLASQRLASYSKVDGRMKCQKARGKKRLILGAHFF